MKNNSQQLNHDSQMRVPNWLFLEIQEEDFLMGKTPHELEEIEEDE